MPDLPTCFRLCFEWIDTDPDAFSPRRPARDPAVALHGLFQTHVMWHRVAPQLAEGHPDHRRLPAMRVGYAGERWGSHALHKRAMAQTMIERWSNSAM